MNRRPALVIAAFALFLAAAAHARAAGQSAKAIALGFV